VSSTAPDLLAQIKRAKEGDTEAFGELYQELYSPLFRYVIFKCRDVEKAKDIVSETFLKWYESLDRYEAKIKPINYLITIAVRLLINEGKKKGALQLDLDAEEFIESGEESVTEFLNTELEFGQVKEIIDNLPEGEKDVIYLKYIDDKNNSEIAEILSKTEGNIRVIEHRALKKIRKMYDEKYKKDE